MSDVGAMKEAAGFHMAVVGGPGVGVPWGLCALVVEGLISDFPELRPVGGQVLLPDGGQFDHWWAETPSGDVIDEMTAVTFGTDGVRWSEQDDADFEHGAWRARLLRNDPTYDPMEAEPCRCPSCLGRSKVVAS